MDLADAYDHSTYRLLRDLGNHLGLSLAYLHAPPSMRTSNGLSDLEWQAVSGQVSALDFDEHVGDHGSIRTDWIETILDKAPVPGGERLDRDYAPCSAASATARVGAAPG